ncbi:hypothetical protein AYJ58_03620 [Shewanella sp. Pdp11]|uniref:DUF2057 family protein n=1 Tax=Shewanella sp. Pdp11 TaxID=2059264 RepID=UPI000CA3AC02|nr:DUF2057 family protein [Shewanella sp. Pdp11]AUD58632.1 hypothetical protein AYJ58_03620 [Shewanella sp. Pdp11]
MKTTLLNKSLLGLTFVIGALLSSTTVTAASLKSTEALSVISINGEPATPFKPIQLTAGKVLIELKYQDIFNYRADDNGNWVKSEPLYLVLDVKASDSYQITPPNIMTETEARQFIKYPTIQLSINGDRAGEYPLQNHSQLMAKMLVSNPAF